MKYLPPLLLWSAFCLAGCGERSAQPPTATSPARNENSVLSAPGDYLDAVVRAKITAEKTVATVSLNNAIQMFRVERGRNPKNLEEMVQAKVIPRIPAVPADMKIVYYANSGTVQVVNEEPKRYP
jgi:hypothetical protein